MPQIITTEILIAHSQCPHKAFLLLCTNTQGTVHDYVNILDEQRRANQREYLQIFTQQHANVQPYTLENLNKGCQFLINTDLHADGFEADCAILTKGDDDRYEPRSV